MKIGYLVCLTNKKYFIIQYGYYSKGAKKLKKIIMLISLYIVEKLASSATKF